MADDCPGRPGKYVGKWGGCGGHLGHRENGGLLVPGSKDLKNMWSMFRPYENRLNMFLSQRGRERYVYLFIYIILYPYCGTPSGTSPLQLGFYEACLEKSGMVHCFGFAIGFVGSSCV